MQDTDTLLSTLQQVFGFTSFRPGQREAIDTLLQKKSLLCIQPTGHGKSLLYQLPAYLLGDVTVVISPLLALMRDQIEKLNHQFGISAASLNSDQSDEENDQARRAVKAGQIRVLFVAPEQLDHVDRLQFLLSLPIKLIVVDEAHCISTWGHDFRPSYRMILQLVHAIQKNISEVRVLALTATADAQVEEDIKKQLSITTHEVTVLRESMDRPNIRLAVVQGKGIAEKLAICEELLKTLQGVGLIYCATRENCELVAEYLKRQNIHVTAYHAGFTPEEKRKLQQEFISDTYQALASTNALGMGIDKANLRYIIHFDIPGSITAYYQEVGRCGRDGKPALGILIYDEKDLKIQEHFIASALPEESDFEKVADAVRLAERPPNLKVVKQVTGLHPTKVIIVLAELCEQGFLVKESQNGLQVYRWLSKNSQPDLSRYQKQNRIKLRELESLKHYATQSTTCRMGILRKALGDKEVSLCQHCDACKKEPLSIQMTGHGHITEWLNLRPNPIGAMKLQNISEGISLLDGKLRAPLFIRFMKQRQDATEVDDELVELLRVHLRALSGRHVIAACVLLPSQTWKGREAVGKAVAGQLQVPLLTDLLTWSKIPETRQGELLNNDQRHLNVHLHMQVNTLVAIPKGSLLLVDDYIGSGATLKEAGRALRADKRVKGEVIPFTIAALKWHLGKRGYI